MPPGAIIEIAFFITCSVGYFAFIIGRNVGHKDVRNEVGTLEFKFGIANDIVRKVERERLLRERHPILQKAYDEYRTLLGLMK